MAGRCDYEYLRINRRRKIRYAAEVAAIMRGRGRIRATPVHPVTAKVLVGEGLLREMRREACSAGGWASQYGLLVVAWKRKAR